MTGSPTIALYKARFDIFTAVRLKIKYSRVLGCVDCKYLSTFRRIVRDSIKCELFINLKCIHIRWGAWASVVVKALRY